MITKELIDFIKKSKSEGHTDEDIKNILVKNGWLLQDVEEGLKEMSFETPPVPPPAIDISPHVPTFINPNPATAPLTTPINSVVGLSAGMKPMPSVMPKKGHRALLFLFLLLIIGGSASAYYFRENLKNLPIVRDFFQKEEIETVVPPQNPVIPPTNDKITELINITGVSTADIVKEVDTTGWQIYKNSEFAVEFKYPVGFRTEELYGDELLGVEVISNWKIKNQFGVEQDGRFPFVLRKYFESSERLPIESVDAVCKEYKQVEKQEGALIECKEILINGVKYIKTVQDNGTRTVIALNSQSDSFVFSFFVIIPNDQNSVERIKIINSIFSSLKINLLNS